MTFRRLFIDLSVLALLFFLLGSQAYSQPIILHLRNGDRIAGTIISENTNEVKISTVWIKELRVPIAQIERREVPAPPVNPAADVALATPTNAVTPTVNTNTFWRRWKGEAEVGLDVERGATDHQLYHGKLQLTYAQPYDSDPKQFFRDIITYDAEYGKTDGTLSDNRMNGSSKTDFDLNRLMYLYNLGAVGYDRIRAISLQYEEGPGVGYHWIRRTNLLVNLELGGDYQVQDRTDGTRTENAYYRVGEDLTWKINKQVNLTAKFEYSPQVTDVAQFRMRFESNLSYALLFNMSLNFAVIDLYDTRPAAGIPNNDLQIRTSLGVKF